jgi:hypothetical protein
MLAGATSGDLRPWASAYHREENAAQNNVEWEVLIQINQTTDFFDKPGKHFMEISPWHANARGHSISS